MSDPVLRADGVSHSFGDETVLRGVDLEVRRGETLVLLGANGAGKSVLLSCLAGSRRPSNGAVELRGTPVSERSSSASLLVQDSLCLERLSGRENVAFYNRLDHRFTDRWTKYTDRFGLETDLDKPVESYSGGMKRKLELAIALSVDAPVYLLDEPTAALDLTTIKDVHALLDDHRDAASTFVIASHLPTDIDVADRAAVLDDGRIVASGTPESLLASVPPVLESDTDDADVLRDHVLDGQIFRHDEVARGFSPADRDDAPDGAGIRSAEPTYTDMFNYYTRLSGA